MKELREYATATLLTQQVQHDSAGLRGTPMLENINPLPGAKHGQAFGHRDRQMGLRQCGAHMRRHIIRTLQRMFVNRVVFGHQPRQKAFQIGLNRWIVVFLNQQAGRSVADVQRQQSLMDFIRPNPGTHLRCERIQALAMGGDSNFMKSLAHARHSNESACYTRRMLLLIPHLFPPARLLDIAAQDLRLPALETLLARGSIQACPDEGLEAALCVALGIERQQDWPLAPITLEADGGVPGDSYWLRADPVHLRVMRDRIVLTDSAELNVSRQEADALAAAIGSHFGEALSPIPHHPQRWVVSFSLAPNLSTTPLSVAIGRAIEPLMPQGGDAPRFRSLLNELQMLLFTHPVNQAREARGELPINSLWLWGGGHKRPASKNSLSIYTRNTEASALAEFCGAAIHPLPAQPDKTLLETEVIMALDELTRAGQCGDAFGWRESVRSLESNWFVPLLDDIRSIGPQGLHLVDPVNGKALHVQRTDSWKIWRRRRSLNSALDSIQATG